MSTPRTVADHGLALGNACDCGAVRWRVETCIDVSPIQLPEIKWTQYRDIGMRRWTCLSCGAEYLTRVRVEVSE